MVSENAKPQIKSGTGFKNGKWYEFSKRYQTITVIKPWAPVRCWLFQDGAWYVKHPKNFDGLFNRYLRVNKKVRELGYTSDSEQKVYARDVRLVRFFELMPEHVLDVLKRFTSDRWNVLQMLGSCGKPAFDLIQANPVLALAAANARYLGIKPTTQFYRKLRSMLKKRQREVLEWLEFPGTGSTVRIFRKIDPSAIRDLRALWYLREAMKSAAVLKQMAFLIRINAGVLRIVTDPALQPYVSHSYLAEVGRDRQNHSAPRAAYLLRDTIEMRRLWAPDRQILFHSPVKITRAHDDLIDRLNNRNALADETPTIIEDMPAPPLPGYSNDWIRIEPLSDGFSLIEEAIAQKNCVVSYAKRVVASEGTLYLYRVLYPERATLCIRLQGDRYRIYELLTACNENVNRQTITAVNRWLKEVQDTANMVMAGNSRMLPEGEADYDW